MPPWSELEPYLLPFLLGFAGAAVAWVLFCIFRWALVDPRVALSAALERIELLEKALQEQNDTQ